MAAERKQNGFTLIELMIVVAIIGIIASLAIPAYQDYVIRSKVTEVIMMARNDTDRLREYFHLNGALPADPAEAGVVISANRSQFLTANTQISWTGAAAEVTYTLGNMGANATGDVLYTGTQVGSDLKWSCVPVSFPGKYLPRWCQ